MDNSINPEKDGGRKAQQKPRTGLLSCYLANGPTYLRNNHNSYAGNVPVTVLVPCRVLI